MGPHVVEGLHVRAWCAEDHPMAAYAAASTLVRNVPAADVGQAAVARRAVVEIAWHKPCILPSALLGASVTPASDGMLTVTAPVATADEGPLIRSAFDAELHAGMPEEYAEAAVGALLAWSGPPRLIAVDRAAHDLVRSSVVAFRSAARVLAYVLDHGELPGPELLRELIVADAVARERARGG